jgi:hypothetical protein
MLEKVAIKNGQSIETDNCITTIIYILSFTHLNKVLQKFSTARPSSSVAKHKLLRDTKVITKLPNSEQSYKGKVQTHNYINRQNQSTTGKLCYIYSFIYRYNIYVPSSIDKYWNIKWSDKTEQ